MIESPDPINSRLERELQEILDRTDRDPTPIDQVRAKSHQLRGSSDPLRSVETLVSGPGGWIMVFGLALSAMFLADLLPLLAQIFAIGSVGLLLAMVIIPMFRQSPSFPSDEPRNPFGTGTDWNSRLRNYRDRDKH